MNLDETRLKEIQLFKSGYYNMLKRTDNTELQIDLINSRISKLEDEEKEILNNCKVKI